MSLIRHDRWVEVRFWQLMWTPIRGHYGPELTNQRGGKHPLYLALDSSSMCGSDSQTPRGESWSDRAFNIFDAFKSRSMPDNTTIMILDALLRLKRTFLIQFLFSWCFKYLPASQFLTLALSRIAPPPFSLRVFCISACIIISFLKPLMLKNLHPSAIPPKMFRNPVYSSPPQPLSFMHAAIIVWIQPRGSWPDQYQPFRDE